MVAHKVLPGTLHRVWIDLPLIHFLYRPDLVGRLMKWEIDLFELKISFEPRKALKAQLFAKFLAEMTVMPYKPYRTWVVFTYISSNSRGSGDGVIRENNCRLIIEVSLRFEISTTNNQAEYEAVIEGITLSEEVGA